MKSTYTLEIAAPPERVFNWIYDGDRLLQWLPNLVENEVLRAERNGIGSRFRQIYVENGRRMEMVGEVTGFEPGRLLACDIRGEPFDLKVTYWLEDLGGRTRLTQHSEVILKNLPMKVVMTVLAPLIRKATHKTADSSFAKLRQLVESSTT
jgi:uncharacterized protein YndB with AHSA1/START domain